METEQLLETTSHERPDHLATQYEVIKILSEASDLKEAANKIIETLADYLKCITGLIWIIDKTGNNLRCIEFWNKKDVKVDDFKQASLKAVFQPGIALPGRALAAHHYAWIKDIVTDADFIRAPAAGTANLHGGIAFPIKSGNKVLGVIEFFKCDGEKPDEDKIKLVAGVCTQLAQFISQKESEAEQKRLLALLNSSQDSIIGMTTEGIITSFNPAAVNLYGYSAEEIKGKHISILITENKLSDTLKLIEKVKAGEKIDSYETRLKKKDGSELYVSLTISPIISREEEIVGISLTGRNISRRKNIEKALLESEERFRTIINNAPDAVITLCEEGFITDWNPKAEILFGYMKAEIINKKFIEIISTAGEKESFKKLFKTLVKNGGKLLKEINLNVLKKDGSDFPIELNASPTKINNKFTCIAFLRDVTERKKAEEAVKKSERLLNEAQQMTHIGSWEWDVRNDILSWSDELYKIFGYKSTRKKLNLKAYYDQVHPDDAENIRDILQTALDNRTDFKFEHRVIFKNSKQTRHLACKGKVIKDKNNRPVKMIGTAQDVTEQKRIQKQLEDYANEVKRISAQKDKFFSIMAHDLRTPFQGLISFSEFISKNYDKLSKKEIIRFSEKINENARQLLSLMNNLLEWSVLHTGRSKFKREKLNVCEIGSDVIKVLTPTAFSKKIVIKNDLDNKCAAYADSNMLRSCFHNLISNAIKFTPVNGRITVSSFSEKDYINIRISDTGVGINKDDIEKLFRIDVKHTTQGTNKEKGTGLGLILVKEQIEKNGGRIWVESEQGKGTSFYFTVPRSEH